ncbi:MAG: sulfite exporter TauE/SafE family protein [Proteobacteria bacterium]|nr:sulfite exporter TauE/SafE family protein [Pseudomonadota bacterium]
MLIYLTILITSFLGSLHCVGMCGGFVSCYTSSIKEKTNTPHLLYNLGRLLSYLTLGIIAAFIGKGLDLKADLVGLQEVSALISGTLLLVIGFGLIKENLFKNKVSFINKLYSKFIFNQNNTPAKQALLLGIFSALLPCGWLYSYVILAGGSSSILSATLTMLFFWLGTLPALLGTAMLAKFPLQKLRKHAPLIISLFVISAGIYNLYSHFAHAAQGHSCH